MPIGRDNYEPAYSAGIKADARERPEPAEACKAVEPGRVRCESCLGMGYRGGWRGQGGRRAWKINTCRGCGGTGDRGAAERQSPRAARKR